MHTTARVIASVVITLAVVVALFGVWFLMREDSAERAASVRDAVQVATATPAPRGPSQLRSPDAEATPGEMPAGAATLAPGNYSMPNPYSDADPVRSCERGCADYARIGFTLPDGWATSEGLVYKHLNEPGEVAFSVWTVGSVYLEPCEWSDSAVAELLDIHDHSRVPALGSTALANQAGRAAKPQTEVMLGGQLALRVELSVPADLDISTCDRGEYRSWSEWDVADGANSHHAAGQVDVVYVVDVDRRPLVIDASHMPAASPEDVAELEAILDSMHITR